MPNYNRVILVGHLTRDPETQSMTSGTTLAKFGIACNHTFTKADGSKGEEVFFGDVEAWGKSAENIVRFFVKGKPILVEGRLKTESWEDKEGKKQSKTRIVCERWAFIEGKGDDAPRPNMDSGTKKRGGVATFTDDESIPF